ncbi:Asp23/Gls24 family envelope stress response protein [Streptomyces sp. NPDC059814]|uniref:Asp23/Gls24 family envelope stress response protein n=1 Tax=Streptomyces sp. NPDC059814 TaxID=3346959 RepID=UPI003667C553
MTTHTDPPHPTPAEDPDDERLPCGRLLSHVWELWEQGAADPHLDGCPHCRRAVDELAGLESAVRGLRAETDTTETYDATPLTQRVMDVVRLELRPGRPLPLGGPDEDLWIMEAVAARTVRTAAETVTGVRAGSCRIVPGAPRPQGRARIDVRLELHALLTHDLPELADQVRRRVREAVDGGLGLDITELDIRITDLLDPEESPPGEGMPDGGPPEESPPDGDPPADHSPEERGTR